MPGADIRVEWSDGSRTVVNLLVMLGETLNAELKRDHGIFLPGVAKQHPTLAKLNAKYPDLHARTWADAAERLRFLYTEFRGHVVASSSS